MRSSKSSSLPKQRMKICRSVTVQDTLPDGENTKYENDRAHSTTNMNNIGVVGYCSYLCIVVRVYMYINILSA